VTTYLRFSCFSASNLSFSCLRTQGQANGCFSPGKSFPKIKIIKLPSSFSIIQKPEMEFKEFEPRFKSAKTRFKLSAGLNLETFHTILSGTNHI